MLNTTRQTCSSRTRVGTHAKCAGIRRASQPRRRCRRRATESTGRSPRGGTPDSPTPCRLPNY
eukprot:4141474-Lingulodinium_polyedra.AAC.1